MTNGSIKRILLALDAGESNRSALQAATLLASQLHAELHALFVEDVSLLRLAELPFAREMVFGSHTGRRITLETMERQLQQQTARLRGIVDTIAQQRQLKVQFTVLRGHVSNELCRAAQEMDLLILGKNTQLLQRSPKLGKVAQDILSAVNCNVMWLQYGSVAERPVAVLFDGSDAGQRALQLGIQLAHSDHDQLKILYPAVTLEQQRALQTQVANLLQSHGIEAGEIFLPFNTSDALLQASTQYNCRVFIAEAGSDFFPPETTKELIQRSHIPVIVMR